MIRVEHDVVVDRPVSEVFTYLTDIRNLPQWQAGVIEVRSESGGTVAKGTRFTEVRKFLGRRLESTVEVTEYEPDRTFALRTMAGPVPFAVTHTFETVGEGRTRIGVWGEGEPGGFFKAAEPLVSRQARRMFEHDFSTLKDVLEARS